MNEDYKNKMNECVNHFREVLSNTRVGRANPNSISSIDVVAYGSSMKLRDLALVTAPAFDQLLITPFDKSTAKDILKSLNDKDIDMRFSLEDSIRIRAVIPPITAEYKQNLIKRLSKELESHKVSVRQIRMKSKDALKQEKSNSTITEDEFKKLSEEIDKTTNGFISKLDEELKAKTKEIL